MSCHYVNVKNHGRVLIPDCYGSAVYGPHRCTCGGIGEKSTEGRIQKLERKIKMLEKQIKELTETIIK